MDELNEVLMVFQGITQQAANRKEKVRACK
jgi:hypothetical protein